MAADAGQLPDPLPTDDAGVRAFERQIRVARRVRRLAYLAFLIAVGLGVTRSVPTKQATLYAYVCTHANGSQAVTTDPNEEDISATITLVLTARDEAGLMGTIRTRSVAEQIIWDRNPQGVAPPKAQIAAALASQIPKTNGVPDMAFQEALAALSSGQLEGVGHGAEQLSASTTTPPSFRDWVRLVSSVAFVFLAALTVAHRLARANYVPRGERRLRVGTCPHCAYPRSGDRCTECGTEFERWATLARKSHRERSTALASTRDLKEQLAQ
jgi:hypothetical protein